MGSLCFVTLRDTGDPYLFVGVNDPSPLRPPPRVQDIGLDPDPSPGTESAYRGLERDGRRANGNDGTGDRTPYPPHSTGSGRGVSANMSVHGEIPTHLSYPRTQSPREGTGREGEQGTPTDRADRRDEARVERVGPRRTCDSVGRLVSFPIPVEEGAVAPRGAPERGLRVFDCASGHKRSERDTRPSTPPCSSVSGHPPLRPPLSLSSPTPRLWLFPVRLLPVTDSETSGTRSDRLGPTQDRGPRRDRNEETTPGRSLRREDSDGGGVAEVLGCCWTEESTGTGVGRGAYGPQPFTLVKT